MCMISRGNLRIRATAPSHTVYDNKISAYEVLLDKLVGFCYGCYLITVYHSGRVSQNEYDLLLQ